MAETGPKKQKRCFGGEHVPVNLRVSFVQKKINQIKNSAIFQKVDKIKQNHRWSRRLA